MFMHLSVLTVLLMIYLFIYDDDDDDDDLCLLVLQFQLQHPTCTTRIFLLSSIFKCLLIFVYFRRYR